MSLLADERQFGTRLGRKPKTARLDLRLSPVHGGEIRARCDAENECAVGGFDAMIYGQFTGRAPPIIDTRQTADSGNSAEAAELAPYFAAWRRRLMGLISRPEDR
jgi:hypothetical protein